MADFIPLEEFLGGSGAQAGKPAPPGTPVATAALVPLEEFPGTVQREDPGDYALQVFMAKGWSREQAAGIVGNLVHESKLKPEAVGDGGASVGLAQWNKERRAGLEAFARGRGADWRDFNTQLDYVHEELQGNEAGAGQALKGAGSVEQAVELFSRLYERPGKPMLESRVQHARKLYDPEGTAQEEEGAQQVMAGAPEAALARTALPVQKFWPWLKEGTVQSLARLGSLIDPSEMPEGLGMTPTTREARHTAAVKGLMDAWLPEGPAAPETLEEEILKGAIGSLPTLLELMGYSQYAVFGGGAAIPFAIQAATEPEASPGSVIRAAVLGRALTWMHKLALRLQDPVDQWMTRIAGGAGLGAGAAVAAGASPEEMGKQAAMFALFEAAGMPGRKRLEAQGLKPEEARALEQAVQSKEITPEARAAAEKYRQGLEDHARERAVAELRQIYQGTGEKQLQAILADPEMLEQARAAARLGFDKEMLLAEIRRQYPGISDSAAEMVLQEEGLLPVEQAPPSPSPAAAALEAGKEGVSQELKPGETPGLRGEGEVVSASKPRVFPAVDLDKAVELGDVRSIIRALGGFSSKSRIIKEVTSPEERKRLFGLTKNPEKHPEVVDVDVFLEDARSKYPHLFPYESDGEFIRAIIDKSIYKKVDVVKMKAEEEAHYAELERREAAIREQAAAEGLNLEGLEDLEADVAREIAAERASKELERDLATGRRGPEELDLSWDEAAAEYGLTPPRPKTSKLEARLAEIADDYPQVDPEKASTVLRSLPEANNLQVAVLAADPELFSQAAKGNLSASEKEQLYQKATDAGQQMGLPGLGTGLFYSGGPDTVELAKEAAALGARVVEDLGKRLERSLPEKLRSKDASDFLGTLMLKIQAWDDIPRTYPQASPFFRGSREGLGVKTRLAEEFAAVSAPYSTALTPAERANVDRVLVERDQVNSPAAGREWRLGADMDGWRVWLERSRSGDAWTEGLKEKGVLWYMNEGLSRKEAEGAYSVRMGLDYARADIMDKMTRVFQTWLQAHGFDRGQVKNIIDLVLHTDSLVEEIAKAYFGEEPGVMVLKNLGDFRQRMQYWLKEQNEYIPRARYGELFLWVYDRDADVARKAREFLGAIDERFPGGRDAARNPEKWPRNKKGKLQVPETIRQQYLMMKKALEMENRENQGKDVKAWKGEQGHRLVEEALKRVEGELVHAEAARNPKEFHEKKARLQQEFPPSPRYEIRESRQENDPIEIKAETDIPRVWRLVQQAGASKKMPLEAHDAMVETWHDLLASFGFGAHYISRHKRVIGGYETDLLQPLNGYFSGYAGYAGKMHKIKAFSEAYENFPQNQPNLLRSMNDYTNYILTNPPEYQRFRNLLYNLVLGGNISFHWVLNPLQNMVTGWPVLGKVSNSPAREILGAMKDWGKYLTKGEGLREGEDAALARARFEPELSPSGLGEMQARAYSPLHRYMHHDPTSVVSKGIDWFKAFWYGEGVEKMNRESFFLAAWRATEGDFQRSIELTKDAHFLYGRETRPAVFRGAGAIMGTFQTFMVQYLTLMKNFTKAIGGIAPETYGTRMEGAKGLLRLAAGALLAGGLAGAPVGLGAFGVWGVVKNAWRQVYGSDLEEDGKKFLAEDLELGKAGEFAGRALFRGLPAAALGIDISGRVAPNVPFMNLPPGESRWTDVLGALAGAGGIPLQKLWGASWALSEGQYGRMLEQLGPVSVANLLQAYRLSTEGATTMSGRPIFTKEGEQLQLTPGETAAKAIGAQPVRVSEHWAQTAHAREMERGRKREVQNIAGELTRAYREGDGETVNRVVDDWMDYNEKMQARGRVADKISQKSVEAAMKKRLQPVWPDVSERKMRLRAAGE